LSVEIFGLMTPHKIASGHIDRAQYFLRIAFSARGNLQMLAAPLPGIKPVELGNEAFRALGDGKDANQRREPT
jgi:hypothetical protein